MVIEVFSQLHTIIHKMSSEDAEDIYLDFRRTEEEAGKRPLADYIERIQAHVTIRERGIAVNLLLQCSEALALPSDSVYLAVSCIDRYLSEKAISPDKLYLLSVTSFILASTFEEDEPPTVSDVYSVAELEFQMKDLFLANNILEVLNDDVGHPTTKDFLRYFIEIAKEDGHYPAQEFKLLANYLSELSLIVYCFIRFLPSVVAASAVFLARFLIDPFTRPWSSTLQQKTGYKVSDLADCIRALYIAKAVDSLSKSFVREKYVRLKKQLEDLRSVQRRNNLTASGLK